MDAATPTMKAPEGAEQTAPTNRVGEAVPEMKAPDSEKSDAAAQTGASDTAAPTDNAAAPADSNDATAQTPNTPSDPMDTAAQSTTVPKFIVTEEGAKEWIGRPIYSSDNKKLGDIAALQRGPDGTVGELNADMGGFLGFGETRVRITADQIKEVKDDSLVVTLTEAEAKNLPAIDKQ
jgi:hypothetical protein